MNDELEDLMAEIRQLRKEYREQTDHDQRIRLLIKKQRLRQKIDAVDVVKERPRDALLQEINDLYRRKVGDRDSEAIVAVRLKLLWNAIDRRSAA